MQRARVKQIVHLGRIRADRRSCGALSWGFIWLMLVLKIPIVALLWLVWWAVRAAPEQEPAARDDDGGIRSAPRHPRRPFPRTPRRGPHGDPAPLPPPRVRTVQARARTYGH
jgi:hypothetical protein